MNRESEKAILTGLCLTMSVLEHQRLEDADRRTLRANMQYFYAEADKLAIPFQVQNEATKAGHDNDLRVVYLANALERTWAALEKWTEWCSTVTGKPDVEKRTEVGIGSSTIQDDATDIQKDYFRQGMPIPLKDELQQQTISCFGEQRTTFAEHRHEKT